MAPAGKWVFWINIPIGLAIAALAVGLLGESRDAYGMAFIISLYGQEVLGYSALKFGVAAVVLPIGVALGAGIGQALVTRRGARAVSAVGIAGLAVGFVLIARLPSTAAKSPTSCRASCCSASHSVSRSRPARSRPWPGSPAATRDWHPA